MKDWFLAILRYSDKWRDSDTDIPGSAYYFIPSGESYSNDQGQELVVFDDSAPEQQKSRPILRFNGGKPTYEKLPAKAYITTNPTHKGSRLMTVAQFDAKALQLKTAVVQDQPTDPPN